MKTTDLIPLILLELNDSDKYGFELTKSIESKSQGKIVIKQPTLYTVLKKLEKSKFISSYWEDSDIGGKRHYYKITDNGRLQVSTLPDFSTLISGIINDGSSDVDVQNTVESDIVDLKDEQTNNDVSVSEINYIEDKNKEDATPSQSIDSVTRVNENKYEEPKPSFSIMDMILNDEKSSNESAITEQNDTKVEDPIKNDLDISYIEENEKITLTPELKESVIPTAEVFAENNLENLTDTAINESNLDVLKTETASDQFASNNSVSSFADKQPKLSKEYKEEIKTKSLESLIVKEKPAQQEEFNYQNVKYVDYTNFTTDEKHVKAKILTRKLTTSVCLTSLYLFAMILLSTLCVKFSGASPLFYTTIIISCVSLAFYPALFFAEKEKIRLKLVKSKYKPDFKKQIIIAIVIELVVVLISVIVNVAIGNYNIIKMFSFKNFENIYAEILISSTLFIDIMLKYLYTKKYISLE